MVFVLSPYISSSYFQFQVNSTSDDFTAVVMNCSLHICGKRLIYNRRHIQLAMPNLLSQATV